MAHWAWRQPHGYSVLCAFPTLSCRLLIESLWQFLGGEAGQAVSPATTVMGRPRPGSFFQVILPGACPLSPALLPLGEMVNTKPTHPQTAGPKPCWPPGTLLVRFLGQV